MEKKNNNRRVKKTKDIGTHSSIKIHNRSSLIFFFVVAAAFRKAEHKNISNLKEKCLYNSEQRMETFFFSGLRYFLLHRKKRFMGNVLLTVAKQ